MPCTKTGCQIYLEEYDEYAWCDAYEFSGIAYFRIAQRSKLPMSRAQNEISYIIHRTENHFDKGIYKTETLIALSHSSFKNKIERQIAFNSLDLRRP